MTEDQERQIDEFFAAGDKATQGSAYVGHAFGHVTLDFNFETFAHFTLPYNVPSEKEIYRVHVPNANFAREAFNSREALKALRDERDRYKKIIGTLEGEIEMEMSRADHKKAIALMDYHKSEEQHQDGRWHQANDLRKFLEEARNKALKGGE